MVQELLPGVSLMRGRLRKALVQSLSSVSLNATSTSTQSEVDIPIRGDILAIGIELTVAAGGTLSSANTLASAISEISIKDKGGVAVWTKLRGTDLPILDRFFNVGRSRTVATITNSAQTHRFMIWNPITTGDQGARLQLTLASYGALDSSGATSGTVSVVVTAYYADAGNVGATQRISRITQSCVSGTNRFAPNLPKGKQITDLLFSLSTEGDIDSITFSADGRAELASITLGELEAFDDVRLVSGHVSGQFSLYVTPFVADTNTQLDVEASASEDINWFIIQNS